MPKAPGPARTTRTASTPTSTPAPTVGTAQKLRTIVEELSREYVERETTLQNGVLALLARQHHMVIGPIGAAKSAAHEAIVARVEGANFFTTQMHDAMKTDELFGQIDMPTYDREGRWVRRTEGYLPSAHLAMIDEIDKGQHLLRSLLRVANERRWRNGDAEMDLPLITMVASANAALGPDLLPVWDRFLIRESVSYIAEATNFMHMLAGEGKAETPTTVTLDELQSASRFGVPSVTVGDEILEALFDIREELQGKGIIVSDRRWKDSVRLLQARAFLAGRAVVANVDLDVLRHVLWSTPEQVDPIAAVLLTHVNVAARKIASILEDVAETAALIEGLDGQSRTNRLAATADLAARLTRLRAEILALDASEGIDALANDRRLVQRRWLSAKARVNEICGGMEPKRSRDAATRAWAGA